MIANSEMKENIEYIIIDDSITSLDTENRYHLTKIINQSSFDFHNFAFKGKKNTKETSYWYIEKIDGISKVNKLSKEELSSYSDYYRTVFNEVMSFAIKGKSKINKINNHYNDLSVTEVHQAIRNVIGIIYYKYKQHINVICNSVLNKGNKEELQKWI